MIEILKGFIKLIVNVFNQLFVIPIHLSDTWTAPLGMILLSFAFLCISIYLIFFFALGMGGDK